VHREARKPSLTVIARKCAVSRMTVSRVLRNEPNVSPATRGLVLRVAEKMGFRPSGCYNANQHPSTKNSAILFQPEYSQKDAFFSGVILSVQRELFGQGFDCSVGIVKNDYSEFLKLNRMLRARQVTGVLVVGDIAPSYAEVLRDNFLNLVLLDYPGDPGTDRPFNAICVENFHGAYLALNHLLKLGRKRILLIFGKEGHYFSNDLLRAYKEAMAQHHVELDSRLLVPGDFHVKSGFKAVKAVLEAGISFDGVFSNDEMACGAIKALKQFKLRVPKDVSVVGFDGLPIGEVISPALTTVVVDREKMGRLAVKRLLALEQKTSDDEKVEKICIFPELLIRESCGFATNASA